MGVTAGTIATAGKMPGERMATRVAVADSDNTTTAEIEVFSVTVPIVQGRVYKVHFYGHVNSSVSTDDVNCRIKEDDVNGTELQIDRVDVGGSATSGRKIVMEIEYTAPFTGTKTFVITVNRSTGTGSVFLEAASNRPAIFAVDYIRG